jgi:uncharacterized membrane protein
MKRDTKVISLRIPYSRYENILLECEKKQINVTEYIERKMILDDSESKIQTSKSRHIAKTISYRLVSTGVGFLIMWLVSGNVKVGAAFGVAELVYKPIQYYIHERIWYRYIKYGLSKKK